MELLKRSTALFLCLIASCVPDLDVDESKIEEPRVLAIQAEPAEAAPGKLVAYRALVVEPGGQTTDAELKWFYCTAPKPLAELGPISRACLDGTAGALTRVGEGDEVEGTLPSDVCSIFGPNPPAPVGDQPPGRPADPDQTGGYKTPVLLGLGTDEGQDIVLYEQRIACGLPGVNPETSIAFNQRYHPNTNPSLSSFVLVREGDDQALADDEVLEVAPGERVPLAARWPACPASDSCGDGVCGPDETLALCAEDCQVPVGCGGQERYLFFDTEQRELVVRTESLRVAWYSDGGHFDYERTGVSDTAEARQSANDWTAPDEAGDVHLWTVLRDDRGGVGFRGLTVRVR